MVLRLAEKIGYSRPFFQNGIFILKPHERPAHRRTCGENGYFSANQSFKSWMSLRRDSGIGISIFAIGLGQGRLEQSIWTVGNGCGHVYAGRSWQIQPHRNI